MQDTAEILLYFLKIKIHSANKINALNNPYLCANFHETFP